MNWLAESKEMLNGVYHIQAGPSTEVDGQIWAPVFCGEEPMHVPIAHTVSARGLGEVEPWKVCEECARWAAEVAEREARGTAPWACRAGFGCECQNCRPRDHL